MMIIIIISLKRITLCKSTIDDDYTQGSSSTIAIRISSFSTKESRLANERGDNKTPKSNLLKSILFSTIVTTAMSNDVALSRSLSTDKVRFVLFCFVFWSREAFARWDAQLTRGYFFFWVLCSHTIGWQLFFGALVDCEDFLWESKFEDFFHDTFYDT